MGGESKFDYIDIIDICIHNLPTNKPKYIMGVGYPMDILISSLMGADLFDSVYACRTARFGTVFTKNGNIKIRDSKWKYNYNSICEGCECECCK